MGTWLQDTGKSIDQSFEKFHKENPKVYDMFKEQVFRAIRLDRNKSSANMIINWIRWEVALRTKTDDEYKINNNFSSRYARLFVKDHPEHAHMFNFRDLRAEGAPDIKKPPPLDEYAVQLLFQLHEGAIIYYHGDNDTVGMVGKDGEKRDITMPQFNKLKNQKLIGVSGQLNILSTQYTISEKGRRIALHKKKVAA